VDIPNVTLGQKVTMTFGAIDGLTATGKVEKMDSLGTLTQNVVTYNITIGFDSLDNRIKPEMSVSANIITNVKQDVMTVPNGAIKTQGTNNYVEVLKGQTPQQINVETGISNNTDTEITGGLNPGDQVVTQTISANSNANTNANSSSGNRSGGFGGGAGGLRLFGGGGPRD
jgi:HlyD family secretion protein